jgi:hypothetical protein
MRSFLWVGRFSPATLSAGKAYSRSLVRPASQGEGNANCWLPAPRVIDRLQRGRVAPETKKLRTESLTRVPDNEARRMQK